MMKSKIFLMVIKEEIKARQDIFKDYKITKIIHISDEPIKEVKCNDGTMLYQYFVITDKKAKKNEDNRIKWKMNVYSDGTILCYYETEYYA